VWAQIHRIENQPQKGTKDAKKKNKLRGYFLSFILCFCAFLWQISVRRSGVKTIRPHGVKPRGRMGERELLLFLLGRSGGLSGLRLGHALLEFIHAAGGIDEFLRAGIEGVAGIANAQQNDRLDGASFDHVAAGATDFRFLVFRMYICFHNKGRTTYQHMGI
jgi:hypothetical protein